MDYGRDGYVDYSSGWSVLGYGIVVVSYHIRNAAVETVRGMLSRVREISPSHNGFLAR